MLRVLSFHGISGHLSADKVSSIAVAFVVASLAFSFELVAQQPTHKEADEKEYSSYDKDGLSFQFPGNWKLKSEDHFSGTRLLILEGPENSMVTMQFTDSKHAGTLREYAEEFSETARKTFKQVEQIRQAFGKSGTNRAGFEFIEEKYTIATRENSAEDRERIILPHQRMFLKKEFQQLSCLIVCQASQQNWKLGQPGFEKITRSLTFKNRAGD